MNLSNIQWVVYMYMLVVVTPISAQTQAHFTLDSLRHLETEMWSQSGNLFEKYEFLKKKISVLKSVNDTFQVVESYIKLADISRQIGNHYQGLNAFEQLKTTHFNPNINQYAIINCVKGSIHYELNNKDSAIYYARKGLVMASSENVDLKGLLYNLLGSAYKGFNNDSSLKYVQLSADLILNSGDSTQACLPLINLSKTYGLLGRYNKSETILKKCISLLNKQDEPIYRQMAYHELSQIYIAQKKFDLAVKYLSLRDSVNYELKNNETLFKLQQAEERAQDLVEQEKINRLNSEVAYARLLQEKSDVTFRLASIIIFVLIVVVALIFYFYFQSRRQAKERLEKSIQLSNLNQFKNKVLSIIGHDLRAPMAQVVTYQQAKVFGVKFAPDTERKMDETLLAVGENGLLVLDNLLKWAQSQSNGHKLHVRQENVKSVVTTIIHQAKSLSENKRINVLLNCEVNNWNIDLDLFSIVLRNLISNALKFTPMESNVEVNVDCVHNELHILVKNQGKSISESIKNDVLNGKSVKPEHGNSGERGAGLGLVLTADFVKIMGGQLRFITPKEGGTIAAVELPNSQRA